MRLKKGQLKGTKDGTLVGGFLQPTGDSRRNPVKVSLGKIEKLSEADCVAANGRLDAPADKVMEKPLEHRGTRHWPKKSLIKGKKTALSILTLSEQALASADPRYAACLRQANGYRKVRARELVISHGYVSSGCSSLLSSAALALASSRYLYEVAAEKGDVALLQAASKLATDARQTELAAWELCSREAVARKKAAAGQEGVPWLTVKEEKPKRGPGRPRKDTEVTHAGNHGFYQASGSQVITVEAEAASSPADGTDGTGKSADSEPWLSGSAAPTGSSDGEGEPDRHQPGTEATSDDS